MQKIGLLFFLVIGIALGGCNAVEEDSNVMSLHSVFRDDVKTWDPANGYDTYSSVAIANVYETLYQYSYLSDDYKIVPLLAADFPSYSADGLTVKIPIRHGIKFQDDPSFTGNRGKGRELHAEDFIYAFKRLAAPSIQSTGWWIFDGRISGLNEFRNRLAETRKGDLPKVFASEVAGLKAPNPYTLEIKLTKRYPQLLYVLAMNFTAPVPHEAIDAYADENGSMVDHAIGTGPFLLKKWERGQEITLERNPNYHPEFYPAEGSMTYRKRGMLADAGKLLPFLDRVSIKIIREQQPAWSEFLKGGFDLMVLSKDNFDQAITNQVNLSPDLAEKGIRLNIETGVMFYTVSFNMKDKILGRNKFLRQAISSAIDREKWIELFSSGTGKKQITALPPGIPDRPNTNEIKYDYNLTLAKELMRKAGYPQGNGLPVLNFDMRGSSALERQYGDFFKNQLATVGIRVNVIYNTFPAFLEKMRRGDLQLSVGAWAMDYPDPENLYQLLYGPNKSPGPNDSNFDNPEMNKIYEKMAILEPGAKRAVLIEKMEEILQEECPWALGYYHTRYFLSQPWLLNFRGTDMIRNQFKYLRILKDRKKRYLEAR